MRAQIIGIVVLPEAVSLLNIAKLEVLAGPLNIVVYHVDEDGSAENALLLQQAVNQVQLVTNCLLLLLGQLGFLGAVAGKAGGDATFDLERAEDVLETGQKRLLFFLRVGRLLPSKH